MFFFFLHLCILHDDCIQASVISNLNIVINRGATLSKFAPNGGQLHIANLSPLLLP